MELLMTLFIAALFYVLTPGILVTLPKGGSKMVVAATHALVFAVIYGLVYKFVWRYLYEGFANDNRNEDGVVNSNYDRNDKSKPNGPKMRSSLPEGARVNPAYQLKQKK